MLADRPRTLGLPTVADWRGDYYDTSAPSEPRSGLFATQLSILKIPAVWILALSSAALYVTRYGINSWGILYLQEARGFSLAAAGAILTASTIAGVAGALAFGFVSDKFFGARRPPVNLLFGLIEIGGLLLLFYGPQTTIVAYVAVILFGFSMTGLVTSLGGLFAIDICPKRVAGAALGMVGVFSYIGAAIQEQVSGALIDSNMRIVGTDRIYDFTPAIWFWIGCSIVGTLLASTLWNTKLRD
jgi:OPA family sugar phosphate sensor protein UhpC-like MFS transporter